ncbi:MAG: FAD binding domain-containing protein [Verrucomicrobiota bacterium]
MKIVDFRIPTRLAEAQAILRELGPSAFPMAGGTSLVFLSGTEPKTAVDLTRLGLDGVHHEDGAFRIGAAARIASLQHFRAGGWVLDRVARHLASQQIRNMSTVGGNIMRIFPWADFPVALLALDAAMVIAGDGERTVGSDEFFSGQPGRLLKSGELLSAIRVQKMPASAGFGYRKETRAAMGFSLMTVAAVLELRGREIAKARVAIGAGVPFPARLTSVEAAILGRKASEELFREAAAAGVKGLKLKAAAGVSDEYTAHLAEVTMADALTQAWAEAGKTT